MSEGANRTIPRVLSYLIHGLLCEIKDIRSPFRQRSVKKNKMNIKRIQGGREFGAFDIAVYA